MAAAVLGANSPSIDRSLDVYAAPQQQVSLPDGRRMNFYCQGTGTPTVILEAGAGGSTLDWRKVQPAMARLTRVCAYDRAGMGFSAPGPMPRNAVAVAADLAAFLESAGIHPPYVIVAHSLGSYYVRLFTDTHLKDVAGMVLVDPSVEEQDRRFGEVSPGFSALLARDRQAQQECLRLAREGKLRANTPVFSACTYGYARDPSFSDALYQVQIQRRLSVPFREALLSETDQMEADSRELVSARRPFGDMPLIVLTQSPEGLDAYPGLTAAQVDAMNALWMQMHDELAQLSSRGVNKVVDHSGHYIQNDRPDAVIAAVTDVLRMSAPASH